MIHVCDLDVCDVIRCHMCGNQTLYMWRPQMLTCDVIRCHMTSSGAKYNVMTCPYCLKCPYKSTLLLHNECGVIHLRVFYAFQDHWLFYVASCLCRQVVLWLVTFVLSNSFPFHFSFDFPFPFAFPFHLHFPSLSPSPSLFPSISPPIRPSQPGYFFPFHSEAQFSPCLLIPCLLPLMFSSTPLSQGEFNKTQRALSPASTAKMGIWT